MKSFSLVLAALVFLLGAAFLMAARPEPQADAGPENGPSFGFGAPGGVFGIPGLGDPSGIVITSVVCDQEGPCYKKNLTCPDSCFGSFSKEGKGYVYGGGGGSCTFDCSKNCTASC